MQLLVFISFLSIVGLHATFAKKNSSSGVVPESWFTNEEKTRVLYPCNIQGLQLEKAIIHNYKPDEDYNWAEYHVQVAAKPSDNYQIACEKARLGEDTSNIEEAYEDKQNAKKRSLRHKKYINDGDVDIKEILQGNVKKRGNYMEDTGDEEGEPKPPTPPPNISEIKNKNAHTININPTVDAKDVLKKLKKNDESSIPSSLDKIDNNDSESDSNNDNDSGPSDEDLFGEAYKRKINSVTRKVKQSFAGWGENIRAQVHAINVAKLAKIDASSTGILNKRKIEENLSKSYHKRQEKPRNNPANKSFFPAAGTEKEPLNINENTIKEMIINNRLLYDKKHPGKKHNTPSNVSATPKFPIETPINGCNISSANSSSYFQNIDKNASFFPAASTQKKPFIINENTVKEVIVNNRLLPDKKHPEKKQSTPNNISATPTSQLETPIDNCNISSANSSRYFQTNSNPENISIVNSNEVSQNVDSNRHSFKESTSNGTEYNSVPSTAHFENDRYAYREKPSFLQRLRALNPDHRIDYIAAAIDEISGRTTEETNENLQRLYEIMSRENCFPRQDTMEEFLRFLQKINSDNEFKTKLIQYVASIGGNSGHEVVRNVMSKLVGDNVALEYNFDGRKYKKKIQQKQGFVMVSLWPIIRDVAHFMYPKYTAEDAKKTIATYLKQTQHRIENSKK